MSPGRNPFRRLWSAWLSRRLPPNRRQTLSHRSVFIRPTALGLGYLMLCAVLFIFGTNYQNNLILALCFLLVSLFNTTLLLAFRNLAGLTLAAGPGHSRHAGEAVPFDLTLTADRVLYHLELRFPGGPARYVRKVQPLARTVQVQFPSERRGWLRPGRLVVSSAFPLGLCRVWSNLDLDQKALVWPAPAPGTQPRQALAPDPAMKSDQHRPGVDDFHGLSRWQPGQSLARVAWKQAARGGEWQAKAFVTPQGLPSALTLDPSLPLETALSQLTFQARHLFHRQQPYRLVLGQTQYGPDHAQSHLERCLDALACYPEAP
ncbi:DUF58 domain-containing protein [Ferrimonas balearica]|uniref:DUF58 domain-containing protein n=1 Tax=Ferrimonas balearica TaxID=44012 RepID=UPI001C995336|nr:DUF58 domain-containing protein [Ferrimonas balearica]MBY5991089.1 DUF58 domain-containing protein [Ferrimonas balearica]